MLEQKALSGGVVASQDELPSLEQIDRLLHVPSIQARLTGPDGESVPLPDSVYRLLSQVIPLLKAGKAVEFLPLEHELSTQQAAALLNVSRPFLIDKLLQPVGSIPYHRSGTHRRIYVKDLLDYKQQRDRQCHQALDELTQMSQDLGFYDLEAVAGAVREDDG
ncbi:excisionase family DNA-binding protein [Gloeobacter kilaueensis]|uniref:Helix-turn-helix domain-containing protein n=1 Tax=Gloeobacter kilaueensis (strain ATCC BAA-2537 / CCAP 1431/1 / ULC 316 / JS1) TaxID=1183438 RepID=U5QRX7_GLOK1|nr:excisionase family DNA-binding protein [Gloeobacter kilaueensis]AGY60445.1 hypothetical protein GKIL_4199 [Gloeobacter kilaueensis JS1]